ncbi:MAG: succinate dehydrogenase, hydrophobic membrane anchor protein [Paracoccaceae bacterium]
MIHRTPRARVSGLGPAGQGTHHWWLQRISSLALIPLTVLFMVPFASALGSEHGAVLALYAHPVRALVAVLFIAVAFRHLALGLQVVIEDYVHAKAWRTGLLVGNSMFCFTFGLAGVFAVLKIAFTG